jgi:transcriptional regulator with XRE-family HTH domain
LRTLHASLSAAYGAAVQKPAWLIELSMASTLRLSSFDTVTWNGQTWTAADVDVTGLRVGALDVKPVDLVRETGMSKATISDIVNGRTNYYRALVNQMALVLRIEPFELLMHPDEAFALRRLRAAGLSIAAEPVTPWHGKDDDGPEWATGTR